MFGIQQETPKVRVKYVGKETKNIGRWQDVKPGTVLTMTESEAFAVADNAEFEEIGTAKGKPAQLNETK